MNTSEIIPYNTELNKISVDVFIENETVWLTQKQMSFLFDKDVRTINEHVLNVYKEKELDKKSTIRKFRIVQKEGTRNVERNIDHYNLDIIISVGYRVKSSRGTHFRIWATRILREKLLENYKRKNQEIELKNTIDLIGRIVDGKDLDHRETTGLLKVITDYSYALDLLDQYDHQCLEIKNTNKKEVFKITYEDAMKAISDLGKQFIVQGENVGTLFGKEKDGSFQGSLYNIYQTFGEQELLPSIEEKATNLLYYVIKNHSFVDGNKRIAAFLFIWFLERNNYLYSSKNVKRINDNALVAICLMIAESRPEEKDTITKLVVNLINQDIS